MSSENSRLLESVVESVSRPFEASAQAPRSFWLPVGLCGVLMCGVVLVWFGAPVVGAAALLGDVGQHSDEKKPTDKSAITQTSQKSDERSSMPLTGGTQVQVAGYVVANNRAAISSDITGRIAQIVVVVGQQIAAGDLVAKLDDQDAKIRLTAAQIKLAKSQLNTRNARLELAEIRERLGRAQRLRKQGYLSAQDFTDVRTRSERKAIEVEILKLQSSEAQNEVEAAENFVARHLIRAPFDGVVVDVPARPGETVSPASSGTGSIRTAIAQLVDPTDLYVEAEIPERYFGQVEVGQTAVLAGGGLGEEQVEANISWIAPMSNRQRGLVGVGIELPSHHGVLLDGMELDVEFLTLKTRS